MKTKALKAAFVYYIQLTHLLCMIWVRQKQFIRAQLQLGDLPYHHSSDPVDTLTIIRALLTHSMGLTSLNIFHEATSWVVSDKPNE